MKVKHLLVDYCFKLVYSFFLGYLRGVDFISQTSITIKADEAKYFVWKEYGFRLHVPEKALPPDLPQCTLHIQASLSGQYQFPKGSQLVSAVYWISAPVTFSKPLMIDMQHACLSPLQLKFVKAQCTQKQLPYRFEPILESNEVFAKQSSYGSISTTKFSAFGIIVMIESFFCYSYIVQVLKSVEASYRWRVFFVVTKDLHAIKTVSYVLSLESVCLIHVCSLFRKSLVHQSKHSLLNLPAMKSQSKQVN